MAQVRRKRYLYFKLSVAGRFARVTGPRFPDYIRQRMRDLATDSGPLGALDVKNDVFQLLLLIAL